ncbi:PREDICTED: uncharacterized protein LOC109340519 [Lupinus angustifolius]|uniref:uncharacterized protein LOC109340519 n=1 Tax=Lupinus angustifolius TaxID=3871 RepID=UPI00092E214E|nr:PREDICTED: uncharacterized protein LOC109340519 [Lupinus angustifolius]
MPTDDNIRKRGCAIVSICNMCNSHSEEEDHLFLHCRFASKLWDWIKHVFSINLNNSSLQSIFYDCAKMHNKQVKEVHIACAINTLSTIWFCRNQKRFEGILITISQAIRRIKRDTSLAGNSSSASASPNVEDLLILRSFNINAKLNLALRITEVTWLPPERGWIKVNTDGAAHGSPGHSGGGGIFRDHNRVYITAFSKYLSIQNAIYAEFHAALHAVTIAYNRGWKHLWIEVDSSMLLDIFSGKSNPPWSLQNDWIKCKEKLHTMNYNITHIFREGNNCADKLASFGIVSRTHTVWNAIPSFIFSDYTMNRLGMPNYRFRNM